MIEDTIVAGRWIVPSVSVVIPTYNQAPWLERTLAAVAGQTYRPLEVIVVDDGSQDDTPQILARLAAEFPVPLRIVRRSNGGPGAARNSGIEASRGDVVAFTDSDAVPRSDWLERGMARLRQEGVDCAGVEGRVEVERDRAPTIRTHQIENRYGGHFLTCNMLYRREALAAVGGFRTRFREDSDLAFSLIEQGWRIVFEPTQIVDHPPREGDVCEVFRLARKRRNDALLWRRHPDLARRHLGSLYPPSETLVLVGEALVLAGAVAQTLWPVTIGLVAVMIGLPRLVLASLEGRVYSNRDYLTVLAIGLTLPAVNGYYRTLGLFIPASRLELPRVRALDQKPTGEAGG